MKASDFRFTKEFDTVFEMLIFCYKRGLSNENSMMEQKGDEDGDIYILYYN